MSETVKYLEQFGKSVVAQAQIELGARQRKKSYSATWKNGRLVSYTVKYKRFKSDNTGSLKKSLQYEVTEVLGNYLLIFKAESYWYYVNFGRKPGKGVPPNIIDRWIRTKPIRPQKGGGKGFAKVTPRTLKSMAFLINRKIRTFGIEGTRFFTKTVELNREEMVNTMGKRIAKDIMNSISKWPI